MGPGLRSGLLALAGMMVRAVLVSLPSAESAEVPRAQPPPVEHFVHQAKSECLFLNGTQRVRYSERYFYGRQEYVRFHSDRGEYEALTPLGEPDARYWNSQEAYLEYKRRQVDNFCRHNYGIYQPFLQERKVQPRVMITPTEDSSSSPHALLICDVAGFWPSAIKITWLRNGKEEEEARVYHTDLTRNGDWTFQMAVMLETEVEHGDRYTCRVEHASFPEPVTVQWEPDSSRSMMWTGVAGFVLGLVFLVPGLILYVKTMKGQVIHQPPALMS